MEWTTVSVFSEAKISEFLEIIYNGGIKFCELRQFRRDEINKLIEGENFGFGIGNFDICAGQRISFMNEMK
jgi:hypothetical protein